MIATTREQAQCLILAGVDCYTADMMWNRVNLETDFDDDISWELDVDNHHELEPGYIPAWSLSALWDIFVKSGIVLNFETDETTSSEALIDMLVQNLVNAAEGKVKLEINEEFLRR